MESAHLHRHATEHDPDADDDGPRRIAPGRVTLTEKLMRREDPVASNIIDPSRAIALASKSSGAPLPSALRAKFESALDADLGAVRIHSGDASAAAAEAVNAKAFTVGQDIHFAAGQYDPSSSTS